MSVYAAARIVRTWFDGYRQRLGEPYTQLGGFGQLIARVAIGPSTHEQIMHRAELFASEVMPALRPLGAAADAATAGAAA